MIKAFKTIKEEELKRSLWIEFHYAKKSNWAMLTEEKSMVPSVDEYISKLFQYISIKTLFGMKSVKTIEKRNIFSNIKNCFFNSLIIDFEYDKKLKNNVLMGYDAKNACLENGKLMDFKITIKIYGDLSEIKQKIPSIFAHELIHAYENWNRLKNNKPSLYNIAKNISYYDVLKGGNLSAFEETVRKIMLNANMMDRKAIVAQINQELKKYKNEIQDLETGYVCLSKINAYTNFIKIGENFAVIKNNKRYWPELEKLYLDITGKERNVEDIIEYLDRIYNKTWKAIRIKVSRFIRSLYENNDNNGIMVNTINEVVQELKQ